MFSLSWSLMALVLLSAQDSKQDGFDPKPSIEFLIKQQREDGSWAGTTKGGKDQDQPYSVGVSALACMALLEYLDVDPKEIRPVLEKGIKSCLEKSVKPKNHFSIEYSQVYPLRLLCRLMKHPDWKAQVEDLRKEAEAVLKRVCDLQGSGGGWGYSKGGKYTSFGTGDAIIALHEAKLAGFEVDDKVINNAINFLKEMRTEGRGYLYTPGDKFMSQWKELPEKDACERSVARIMGCDWAMFLNGKVTEQDLESSLKIFMNHKNFQWKLRIGERKSPMVTELGSPYFAFIFYAYYNTALALRDIKSDKRKEWAAALRSDLLKAREKEGYWKHRHPDYKGSDTTLGGDSFATANVLLALRAIETFK